MSCTFHCYSIGFYLVSRGGNPIWNNTPFRLEAAILRKTLRSELTMTVPTEILLEGKILPADQGRFITLPFEVPEHMTRMEVHLYYSDRVGSEPWETEGNALGIGICDPRENIDTQKGFRGWSGSSRLEFVIDGESATPGYISGPIQ